MPILDLAKDFADNELGKCSRRVQEKKGFRMLGLAVLEAASALPYSRVIVEVYEITTLPVVGNFFDWPEAERYCFLNRETHSVPTRIEPIIPCSWYCNP